MLISTKKQYIVNIAGLNIIILNITKIPSRYYYLEGILILIANRITSSKEYYASCSTGRPEESNISICFNLNRTCLYISRYHNSAHTISVIIWSVSFWDYKKVLIRYYTITRYNRSNFIYTSIF